MADSSFYCASFLVYLDKTELLLVSYWGNFPAGAVVKNLPIHAEDARHMGSVPGSGRSPGESNGTSLQYSCLGNPVDRGT